MAFDKEGKTLQNPRVGALYATAFDVMKSTRKKWIKPVATYVPIFFECTCYAGAV